jgi:hypothetical protein
MQGGPVNFRAIVIPVVLILYIPTVQADKLQVAARGKKQPVQTLYGQFSSFDGTTLTFEVLLPANLDARPLGVKILAGPQTMSDLIPVKDTEIVIVLGARDLQEPVDAYHPELSVPNKTHDVGLQQAELQKARLEEEKRKASETPVERDLTHCSGPFLDQVVEKNPQTSGATKPPILGNVQSVDNGVVTIKRLSDGAVVRYRLDALNEIRIGMCR